MTKKRMPKISFIILVVFMISGSILSYLQVNNIFPKNMKIIEGEEIIYSKYYPLSVKADNNGVLSDDGTIIAKENGKYNVDLKLFGVIPFKSISLEVMPKRYVIPCGKTVGVKIFTEGILIIGSSPVIGSDGQKYEPWEKASLREGDVILSINDQKISNTSHLKKVVEKSEGKSLNLKIKRNNEEFITEIIPVKCKEDKKYRIGLWVRDSTAGIGTLTYYDPERKEFGALGHGISDTSTGNLLPIKNGEILQSEIVAVRKGEKGIPGELKGVFLLPESPIGSVDVNSNSGIFGHIDKEDLVDNKAIPVATRTQVREGKAYIYSNVESDKIEKYEILVEKVLKNDTFSSKGMIIKVVDKDLINKTGGIVQGMSGSPIVQDGKLIGAVTHVFVNDPTRGYGIFIEWMLNEKVS